jgi:hypothetical protein
LIFTGLQPDYFYAMHSRSERIWLLSLGTFGAKKAAFSGSLYPSTYEDLNKIDDYLVRNISKSNGLVSFTGMAQSWLLVTAQRASTRCSLTSPQGAAL